jgi:uncharacterized protein YjbI with pentapeptide repeats
LGDVLEYPLSVFRGVSALIIIFKNGTNLSGANLNKAHLSGTDLRDANLERANLKEADLTRANLKEANLTEATMSRAKRTVAVYYRVRWVLPGRGVWRDNPKWADLEKGSPFSKKEDLLSTTEAKNLLEGSDRNKRRLIKVNLKTVDYLKIVRLEAVAADLQEADLTGADLSGTNLRKAIITREQLDKAKLLKGTTMPDGTKQLW